MNIRVCEWHSSASYVGENREIQYEHGKIGATTATKTKNSKLDCMAFVINERIFGPYQKNSCRMCV